MSVRTETLKLPAPLERYVAEQVEQGAYPSRQAAIVAAVAGEKRRSEQRLWLKAELEKGVRSPTAGVLNIENLILRGRARHTARQRRRSA